MDYSYLKLLPTQGTKNDTTDKIATKINLIYADSSKRKKKDKLFQYEDQNKLGFYIYISKENISFYSIVPNFFVPEFKTACENAWKGINIESVDSIPGNFTDNYTMTSMSTKKSDALSIRVNKTDNFLLTSLLSVVDILQNDEEVGVYYNFIPISSSDRKNYKANFKEDIDKLKKNYSLDKEKSAASLFKNILTGGIDYISEILEDVGKEFGFNMQIDGIDTKDMFEVEISKSTKDKPNMQIVENQIIILSKSTSRAREKTINEFVADNFDRVKDNNEFVLKHINVKTKKRMGRNKVMETKPFNFKEAKYDVPVNVLSDGECQNLISLPGKTLMDTYKMIDNIPYTQSIVPDYAKRGYLPVGFNNNKGKLDTVYFSNENKEIATTGTYMIGPMGSGKSTFIKWYVCHAIKGGDLVVLFDYIGNNELTRTLSCIPDKYKHIINVGDISSDKAQAIFYNELDVNRLRPSDYKNINDYYEDYLNMLSIHMEQIIKLIKGINGEGTGASLSRRMSKIIRGACILTLTNKNTVFMDIYRCITNHKVRHEFLENVPDFVLAEYEDEIDEMLMTIDDVAICRDMNGKAIKDDDGNVVTEVVGTLENPITFLLDRFAIFKENRQLKKLTNIDHKDNIDFADLFLNLKKKVVIVQVPGDSFMGESKDIICNFYASKILLAMEQRQLRYVKKNENDPKGLKMTMAHVILDEAHLLNSTMQLVQTYLTQFRKFRVKPLFTGHYLGQLEKSVADSILAAGYNFIITGPLAKAHYENVSEHFDGFDFEECKNLMQRHLMVSLKYTEGRRCFVLEAPNDISKDINNFFN